ncbi:MAG: nickel pincer cofactor biosynthesis protein LarB [Nitrososphaeria archaeon]
MLREILKKFKAGEITIDEAERSLRATAIEEVGRFANIDVNRESRKGMPEVILGEGKEPSDIAEIALKMLKSRGRAILSRLNREQVDALRKAVPEEGLFELNERARAVVLKKRGFKASRTGGKIGIMTAGTSDIPVAEEAKVVAEEMGCEVLTAYDVGVAGLHRLFPPMKEMITKGVDVMVVVAGREAALTSVVAGLVEVPVIGVPTSVGYGFGGGGTSALMSMLQACPLGIAVVNIDGGVAAGAVAALIASRVAGTRRS